MTEDSLSSWSKEKGTEKCGEGAVCIIYCKMQSDQLQQDGQLGKRVQVHRRKTQPANCSQPHPPLKDFTFNDLAPFLSPANMDFSSKCMGKDLMK